MRHIFFLIACWTSLMVWGQMPQVDPKATFVTIAGEEIDDASTGQNAPLEAHFAANPTGTDDYVARYEWKIYERGHENSPLVHRFDEDLDYTFTQSGTFYVQLYATFINDGDTIMIPGEDDEKNPIVVSISESKLEMPNAFSPNGDGYNDVYKAKDSYQSIISFKATIFNRWGQKIYSWTDLDGGWDGTWNGRTVSDGVYFVRVEALGADGRKYNIKRDVNVLTGIRDHDNESMP